MIRVEVGWEGVRRGEGSAGFERVGFWVLQLYSLCYPQALVFRFQSKCKPLIPHCG